MRNEHYGVCFNIFKSKTEIRCNRFLCIYVLLLNFFISEIKITITGDTGHALSFVENTCAEKLQKLINGFLQVREEEKAKLKGSLDGSKLGEVTTLNITMINVTTNTTKLTKCWSLDMPHISLNAHLMPTRVAYNPTLFHRK